MVWADFTFLVGNYLINCLSVPDNFATFANILRYLCNVSLWERII